MIVSLFSIPLALFAWSSLAQHLTPPPLNASDSSTSASGTRTSVPSSNGSGTSSGITVTSTPSGTSSANFPSLSGYSPCVSNCLGLAISEVGCNSLVDVQCFCSNATRFTRSLVNCISIQCPVDLINAETVSNQFCALASPNISLSFPPPTSTPSSSSTSTSSTASDTTASNTDPSVPPSPTQSVQPTGGGAGLTIDSSALRGAVALTIGSVTVAFALGW